MMGNWAGAGSREKAKTKKQKAAKPNGDDIHILIFNSDIFFVCSTPFTPSGDFHLVISQVSQTFAHNRSLDFFTYTCFLPTYPPFSKWFHLPFITQTET